MKIIFLVFLIFFSSTLFALESDGEITIENRVFEDDQNPITKDSGNAFFSKINAKNKWSNTAFSFRGFARVDQRDESRNIIKVEDGWFSLFNDNIELKTGFMLFNWSSMEAFHPVDILNSRNYDSDTEKLEKIGELTNSLSYIFENGTVTLYHFPRFEPPQYVGPSSRLGMGLDIKEPIWVKSNNEKFDDNYGFQGGARITYNFGEADVDINYMRRMDRHNATLGLDSSYLIHPYYFYFNQLGISYSHAISGFVLKFESAFKFYDDDSYVTYIPSFPTPLQKVLKPKDYNEIALGGEYGWNYFGQDGTLYVEAQIITGINKSERAQVSIFQRDLLIGYRNAFNDVMGKELFFSFIVDMERSREYMINLNYKQRLSDFWSFKVGAKIFEAPKVEPTIANIDKLVGLTTLEDSDHLYLNLSRFF